MITPTQGRIVVYHPRPSDRIRKMIGTDAAADQDNNKVTHAAIIAHVMSPQLVNLTCFDSHGNPYASQGVVFKHDVTDELPEYGGWCEWMPYQLGQQKKTEEVLSVNIPPGLLEGGLWLPAIRNEIVKVLNSRLSEEFPAIAEAVAKPAQE